MEKLTLLEIWLILFYNVNNKVEMTNHNYSQHKSRWNMILIIFLTGLPRRWVVRVVPKIDNVRGGSVGDLRRLLMMRMIHRGDLETSRGEFLLTCALILKPNLDHTDSQTEFVC